MKGIGVNTFTSGYEGASTTDSTSWTNQYFANLFDNDWEVVTSMGAFSKKWFRRCSRRHYDAYD
jgi:catalase (peroxidase I)